MSANLFATSDEPASGGEFLRYQDSSEALQFVAFRSGDETFAVPVQHVREIIRVPKVVSVPLTPEYLIGLANLRGEVLPILSLRRLFGNHEIPLDDATRAIVVDMGQSLGLLVDRVLSVLTVDARAVNSIEAIQATVHSDYLVGAVHGIQSQEPVFILDLRVLLERAGAVLQGVARAQESASLVSGSGVVAAAEPSEGPDGELQLVSFMVGGQEYAITIESVQEIVQMPATLFQVPHAPHHVLGLMTLRDDILPLVSAHQLFGVGGASRGGRVVVLSAGERLVGLVADAVTEVLRVGREQVVPLPSLLAHNPEMREIVGICRLKNGERMVSVLDPERLLENSSLQEAMAAMNAETADVIHRDPQRSDLEGTDEEQLVVFRLADGEFAVPVTYVQEIVRVPDRLTVVPKAPGFVVGVINLRGTVLPVLDLRRRLGLPEGKRTERQRVMVLLTEGAPTGYIVDAVTEVAKVPKVAIQPSPRLSAEQGELLSRVVNWGAEQRMIQLLDPVHLLSREESETLNQWSMESVS